MATFIELAFLSDYLRLTSCTPVTRSLDAGDSPTLPDSSQSSQFGVGSTRICSTSFSHRETETLLSPNEFSFRFLSTTSMPSWAQARLLQYPNKLLIINNLL